jgi:preprotein translocase subunit YajC
MFDFNEVTIEESKNTNKYLTPGNHIVKTIGVVSGVSHTKKTPYVKITVADATEATCAQDYYLSTTVKEGSTKSAMDISAQNILRVVAAANNIDITTDEGKTKAKALIGNASSPEQLATKLSSLLVGKQFAVHLGGEWINPSDMSKKPYIISRFGGGNFALPTNKISSLQLTPTIKGESVIVSKPTTTDENPFG